MALLLQQLVLEAEVLGLNKHLIILLSDIRR